MFDLVERENSVFEILQAFANSKLPFVTVGGYAVSAYKHRFSIDADTVVRKEDLKGFENILDGSGFSKTISKDLEHTYAEFIRYENSQKVSVDLLINGVAVRQTGAFFSYEILMENSEEKEVIGTEKSVMLRIPKKELLIAMKLHSGRLTDFRDAIALAHNMDIQAVAKFILSGNISVVKENLEKLSDAVENQNFIDSFKGVFAEKKFDVDLNEVRKLCKIFQ